MYPSELVTIGILFALVVTFGLSTAGYNVITVIGLVMAHCLNELDCSDCSKPIKIGANCSWLIQPSSLLLTATRLS
ncbi:MAG: hypothetical protein MZV64_58830 [Ignavibacteriales bacterium]|nr:hypothetical protein [Ignavibacteriales bacterium]